MIHAVVGDGWKEFHEAFCPTLSDKCVRGGAGVRAGRSPGTGAGAGGGGRGGFGGGAAAVPDPQPYDRVITKDAKTSKGLFTVHQIKRALLLRDPEEGAGPGTLWNSQIAKTTLGAGYGGGQYVEQGGPLGPEGQSCPVCWT